MISIAYKCYIVLLMSLTSIVLFGHDWCFGHNVQSLLFSTVVQGLSKSEAFVHVMNELYIVSINISGTIQQVSSPTTKLPPYPNSLCRPSSPVANDTLMFSCLFLRGANHYSCRRRYCNFTEKKFEVHFWKSRFSRHFWL